jgi:hypothetical protein
MASSTAVDTSCVCLDNVVLQDGLYKCHLCKREWGEHEFLLHIFSESDTLRKVIFILTEQELFSLQVLTTEVTEDHLKELRVTIGARLAILRIISKLKVIKQVPTKYSSHHQGCSINDRFTTYRFVYHFYNFASGTPFAVSPSYRFVCDLYNFCGSGTPFVSNGQHSFILTTHC